MLAPPPKGEPGRARIQTITLVLRMPHAPPSAGSIRGCAGPGMHLQRWEESEATGLHWALPPSRPRCLLGAATS